MVYCTSLLEKSFIAEMTKLLALLLALLSHVDASSYADGGDDVACWKAKKMVDCAAIFPNVDITVDWSQLYPTSGKNLTEGDQITIPATLILPTDGSLNVTTTLFKDHLFDVDHTNVHACKTNGGFCSPFISETPGLVTHSKALKGSLNDGVNFDVLLEAGSWTFITHYRIFVDDNIRCDFSKGRVVRVLPKMIETRASETVVAVSISLCIIGMIVCVLFLLASFFWRKKNVFKLASWKFCAIASIGGILGNASVLLWVPPLSVMTCIMRPFLLPIAFDVLYFPLLLKTWRLRKLLIDNANKLKKNKLTDAVLFGALAAPVCVDLVVALIWTLVAPLSPTVVKSLISDTSFEIYCDSEGAVYFMVVVFALKLPFLGWGLSLAWQTRRIMSELNESSHIMLSMINMFFVVAYVCVIQFLMTDSQSALVMLRSLGTFIAATVTLSMVLGPKVVQLLLRGDIDGLKHAMRKDLARRQSQERSESTYETTVPMAMDQTIQIRGGNDSSFDNESTNVYATRDVEERVSFTGKKDEDEKIATVGSEQP